MGFASDKIEYQDIAIVRLSGDVDIASGSDLKPLLIEAASRCDHRLIVDLRDAKYMNSAAVGALVGVELELGMHGGVMAVVCPEGDLRRLFRLAGLEGEMAIFSDVAEAVVWIEGALAETKTPH